MQPLQQHRPQGYRYYYKATTTSATIQVPTACYNCTRANDECGCIGACWMVGLWREDRDTIAQ